MSEHGVLTAEELALLPYQAREWYHLSMVSLQSHAQECIPYLCYELVKAKTEIDHLNLKLKRIHDESQS